MSRIYKSNIASRDFDSVSMATENSVVSLRETPFNRRSDVDKKRLKDMGPERPDLKMQQQSIDRGGRTPVASPQACMLTRAG